MVRLPGDWALLAKKETKDAVELFAKNESAFFEVFGEAWNKVVNKGYDNTLKKCVDKAPSPTEKRAMKVIDPSSAMRDDDATPPKGTPPKGTPPKGKQGKKGKKGKKAKRALRKKR